MIMTINIIIIVIRKELYNAFYKITKIVSAF